MRKSLIFVLAALFITVPMATPAAAGELAGVELAESAEAGGETLVLNGMGLRKKFIVKVYVAGLYLSEKNSDAEAILEADAPRRTVMHFMRGVSESQLCDGWDDGLEANTPKASAEVKEQFETLCGYMADVDKGEEITFTYLPGEGTEVAVRGESQGTIEGKAFADALFACWIGPKPPGGDFKEGLLGG